MAEVTAFRNNATIFPVYGLPYTVVFPMLDADGDLVTGASTPDAEVSLNGDTFADCTNESTEIATSSGMYYLSLTAAEMTADIVSVIAKSAATGMKTTPIVLYPRKLPVLLDSANAGAYDSTTTINLGSSASAIDDFYNGCIVYIYGGTGSGQVRMITDYVGSTKLATVHVAWATNPDATSDLKIYRTEQSPYGIGVTVSGTVSADLVSISGDTAAADNLEAQYDGTGYNTPTAPATKADIRAIAVVEEYLPQYHTDSTVSVGDTTGQIAAADITKISTHDGNTYTIGESGTGIGIDAVLRFSGMEDYDKPLSVEIDGYYNGSASHWVNVLAYNYVTAAYELLHTNASANAMEHRSTERHYSYPLTAAHFDNANGLALIRFQHNTTGNNAHTGLVMNKVVLNFARLETGTIQDVLDAVALLPSVAGDIIK